jgi:predicted alpha/beta hydrolase
MGRFDLPANFDYVLGLSGAEKLYYVGHSMGNRKF